MSKIVLVCGGRNYNDYNKVSKLLNIYNRKHGISLIVHGGAKGADSLAGRWATECQLPQMIFPAQWNLHGKAAGQMRNGQMLSNAWVEPEVCIAFDGGVGTRNMIDRSVRAGLDVYDIEKLGW